MVHVGKMNWKRWKANGEESQAVMSRKDRTLLDGHANGGKVKRLSRQEIESIYGSCTTPMYTADNASLKEYGIALTSRGSRKT